MVKYKDLTEEQKKGRIAASAKYRNAKQSRFEVSLKNAIFEQMLEYMQDNGYKSKNGFVVELIKREIGWKD